MIKKLVNVILSLLFPIESIYLSDGFSPEPDETKVWMKQVKTSTLPPMIYVRKNR